MVFVVGLTLFLVMMIGLTAMLGTLAWRAVTSGMRNQPKVQYIELPAKLERAYSGLYLC